MRRPSLFRRNTSKDLNHRNSVTQLPPLSAQINLARPKSARIRTSRDKGVFNLDGDDEEDCKVDLYEDYGGRGSMLARDYDGRKVATAPVVMSPETISRCICVLIRELMESGTNTAHGEFLSALTPTATSTGSEKAFFSASPNKPSQYDVFRRDYSRHTETSQKGHTINSRISPVKLKSFFSPSFRNKVSINIGVHINNIAVSSLYC